MVEETSQTRARAKWLERVRHVAWAGLIAFILQLSTVLDPIDQTAWIIESLISSEEASGDIALVASDTDLTDPQSPRAREQLADFVTRLDEAEVERVYVDLVFDRASTTHADQALNTALREFRGDAFLVRDLDQALDGSDELRQSTQDVTQGLTEVGSFAWVSYLGYAWGAPYDVSHEGVTLPNMAVSLAGVPARSDGVFPIRYNYERASIPTYRFTDLVRNEGAISALAGKTVVIGPSASQAVRPPNIPGHLEVPPSLLQVYAAETLMDGAPQYIGRLPALLMTLAAILLACSIRYRRLRYTAYAVTTVVTLCAPLIAPQIDVRLSISNSLAVLFVFMLFRARARWRQNLLLVDPDTNLPTFAALEADEVVSKDAPAIIVARIHRFEEVRRSLPQELHSAYLLAITARLKAATQDATIYLGQGHMIAWTMQEKDPALLREHLEGLRALFASPLLVGDQQVDVGITFGIDIAPSPTVARRLAAAVAVAEKTNETFEPIAIADSTSQEDLIWNISLQARIDAALTNGEIYLAFQPKIMVQTGEIIGAEALVRWNDPVKGQIPPDYFIRQCENAGRMSQLTRFVLEEACRAGNAFDAAGLHLPIAVNISATLLHERSIVSMVSEVLDHSAFDPRRLTLEITETYRISNLDLAAEILGELKALGTKISMDDFGVGAASLEALLKLPFSELKIDRMFIAPMTNDSKALGIVKSILQMGKDLRIIVVAEGVEDAGTLTLLRDSGCVVAQGFAISRPVTFDKILEYHKDSKNHYMEGMV